MHAHLQHKLNVLLKLSIRRTPRGVTTKLPICFCTIKILFLLLNAVGRLIVVLRDYEQALTLRCELGVFILPRTRDLELLDERSTGPTQTTRSAQRSHQRRFPPIDVQLPTDPCLSSVL
jgi:hypothetical protein